jgi:hypothetical protein
MTGRQRSSEGDEWLGPEKLEKRYPVATLFIREENTQLCTFSTSLAWVLGGAFSLPLFVADTLSPKV